LKVGRIELDRLDHSVCCDGLSVLLTNKEFALLEYLMLNRGKCVSRVELLDAVWNLDPAQTTNIVDVYVNYLRRKLHDPAPGQFIRTIRGQGYIVSSTPETSNPEIPGFGLAPQVQASYTLDLSAPVVAH
jgi:DNA-binding response OmpR family regulator